jgi:GNAT superfamily N-acetyltransferase
MPIDHLRIALTFRLATAKDVADIARISVRSWQAAYRGILPRPYLDALATAKREAFWKQTIARGTPRVILAQRDDITLGWIAWGPSRDRDPRRTIAEIEALYIDPLHWRKGAGTLLIEEAIEAAASEGYREMTLWVLEENKRGRSFYETMGFTADGAFHPLNVGGRDVDEMRLRLKIQ